MLHTSGYDVRLHKQEARNGVRKVHIRERRAHRTAVNWASSSLALSSYTAKHVTCVRAEIDFYQTKLARARTYSYIIIFPLLIYYLLICVICHSNRRRAAQHVQGPRCANGTRSAGLRDRARGAGTEPGVRSTGSSRRHPQGTADPASGRTAEQSSPIFISSTAHSD